MRENTKTKDLTPRARARVQRVLIARLAHGGDLLDEITELCRREDIRLGSINAIGAVRRARIGFYDQVRREYEYFEIEGTLEIAGLVGNVSVKDGEPFVHAHVTLADGKGKAYGGHLAQGTEVFACECIMTVLDGPVLKREFDEETGLALWR